MRQSSITQRPLIYRSTHRLHTLGHSREGDDVTLFLGLEDRALELLPPLGPLLLRRAALSVVLARSERKEKKNSEFQTNFVTVFL